MCIRSSYRDNLIGYVYFKTYKDLSNRIISKVMLLTEINVLRTWPGSHTKVKYTQYKLIKDLDTFCRYRLFDCHHYFNKWLGRGDVIATHNPVEV